MGEENERGHEQQDPSRNMQAVSLECQQILNEWCNLNCLHAETHGRLVAAYDRSEGRLAKAWRCYAPSTLNANGQYEQGNSYCTRHALLTKLVEETCPPPTEQLPAEADAEDSEEGAAISGPAQRMGVDPLGIAMPLSTATREKPTLAPWDAEGIVTVPAVDSSAFAPSAGHELMRVQAWEVGCIDSLKEHKVCACACYMYMCMCMCMCVCMCMTPSRSIRCAGAQIDC